MKIITRENNANVVELTNEELTSLEKEVKLQEFIKARMPEIKKYETQVKEYIEEHTSTHYADFIMQLKGRNPNTYIPHFI